jgi:phage host-nuclease inhibitor protein Gam
MAKAATKIKQAASQHWIAQSRDEVVEAIAEIGRRQRERQRLEATMNDELAAIKQKYEEDAAPANEKIRELSKGVQAWCEANRAELTQAGKVKHANLPSGEVKWRMRPPSVAVRGVEAVIDLLKRMNLGRFVRSKEEINKEAILLEPDAVAQVPGIKITQAEDFVIVPFESQLEEVA